MTLELRARAQPLAMDAGPEAEQVALAGAPRAERGAPRPPGAGAEQVERCHRARARGAAAPQHPGVGRALPADDLRLAERLAGRRAADMAHARARHVARVPAGLAQAPA